MHIEISARKRLFTASGEFTLTADLGIRQGETVSFFGPSGSGKTTMLRLIAGLTGAEEGYVKVGDEVWFDSKTGVNLAPQKRQVGFVFQDYALFPNMTVRENLRFAQSLPDRRHVDELLEVFGLAALQGRKPAMLSGGQNQRVALARALARRPAPAAGRTTLGPGPGDEEFPAGRDNEGPPSLEHHHHSGEP